MKKRLNGTLISSIIVVLIIIACSVTIAYSALASTLQVTSSKVTQQVQTWNMGFKAETINGSATGGAVCGTATATTSTLTISSITVTKPGDKCSYKFVLKNAGSVGAKVSAITPVVPKNEKNSSLTCSTQSGATLVCGNITYKLRKSSDTSSTLLAVGDGLGGNTETSVYLTAEYSGSTSETDDFFQKSFGYTISFTQN